MLLTPRGVMVCFCLFPVPDILISYLFQHFHFPIRKSSVFSVVILQLPKAMKVSFIQCLLITSLCVSETLYDTPTELTASWHFFQALAISIQTKFSIIGNQPEGNRNSFRYQ